MRQNTGKNRGNPHPPTQHLIPWKKGQSGNPGGRTKLATDFTTWCQAQFETPEGRALLQRRMKKSDYVLVRMLAYAYGEPKQTLKLEVTRSVLELRYPDGRTETRSFEPKASAVH